MGELLAFYDRRTEEAEVTWRDELMDRIDSVLEGNKDSAELHSFSPNDNDPCFFLTRHGEYQIEKDAYTEIASYILAQYGFEIETAYKFPRRTLLINHTVEVAIHNSNKYPNIQFEGEHISDRDGQIISSSWLVKARKLAKVIDFKTRREIDTP